MSNEDKPQDSDFIKHATAALSHAGSAATVAAKSTLEGIKKSMSWENFGHALGGAAMVGAAAKAVTAITDRVSKPEEKDPDPNHVHRRGYRR